MFQTTTIEDNEALIVKPKHAFNKISLRYCDGIEFVSPHQIIYCKSEGSYTSVIMEYKKKLVCKQLGVMENMLDHHNFFRTHRSFLVNLNHIKKYISINGGYLIMSNGDKVNVSRRRKKQLLQLF